MPSKNVQMRRDMRRTKVYSLYMRNKSEQHIADTLGISKSTVKRDLEWISVNLDPEEMDWKSIQSEALQSLKFEKTLLFEAHQKMEGKAWTQAKILSLMSNVDKIILDKIAQPPKMQSQVNILQIKQEALAIGDFLVLKYPDLLPEFKEWIQQKKSEFEEAETSERVPIT